MPAGIEASLIPVLPLADADPAAIEALLDRAFGLDRHGRTAYRLRAGTAWIPALSFAAFEGQALIGTLQSWPVRIGAAPLVMVGPVAVDPDRQQAGIGKALMTALIAAADASRLPGADALMMIGDPDYYARFFGFSADRTGGWAVPGPVERHRLLARGATFPLEGQIEPRTEALVG